MELKKKLLSLMLFGMCQLPVEVGAAIISAAQGMGGPPHKSPTTQTQTNPHLKREALWQKLNSTPKQQNEDTAWQFELDLWDLFLGFKNAKLGLTEHWIQEKLAALNVQWATPSAQSTSSSLTDTEAAQSFPPYNQIRLIASMSLSFPGQLQSREYLKQALAFLMNGTLDAPRIRLIGSVYSALPEVDPQENMAKYQNIIEEAKNAVYVGTAKSAHGNLLILKWQGMDCQRLETTNGAGDHVALIKEGSSLKLNGVMWNGYRLNYKYIVQMGAAEYARFIEWLRTASEGEKLFDITGDIDSESWSSPMAFSSASNYQIKASLNGTTVCLALVGKAPAEDKKQ